MNTTQIENDIKRLGELLSQGGDAAAEEALRLAVGVAGAFVMAVFRIAEALEAVTDQSHDRPAILTRKD